MTKQTTTIIKKGKLEVWSGKMAQEMRMFTDKLDNLSLIPGNHMVEGKN